MAKLEDAIGFGSIDFRSTDFLKNGDT